MSEAQLKANQQYEKKRKIKRASFNLETEGDLYEFADGLEDFSAFVKDYIRERIEQRKQTLIQK